MLTGGARADPRQWCLHATSAAGQVAERRGGRPAPGALASTAGSGFVPSSVDTDQPGARFRGRDLLRTVAEGTAGAVGDEFLRGLVRHVALAFDAKFAFVAEADDPTGQHVRVVSGWYAGGWMDEPFEYDTRGKPCALVVERAVVAFPEALTRRFPEAKPAIEMGLESYLAVCLRAADGTHLGHIGVMDARPMEAGDEDVEAMRIFASRAGAELERRQQAAALRRSRARVIEAADAERRRVGATCTTAPSSGSRRSRTCCGPLSSSSIATATRATSSASPTTSSATRRASCATSRAASIRWRCPSAGSAARSNR